MVGSWFSSKIGSQTANCSLHTAVEDENNITLTVRAVQDFKYDGVQTRYMTLTLRLEDDDPDIVDPDHKVTIKVSLQLFVEFLSIPMLSRNIKVI